LHDRQLVHTDLKPENILLLDSGYDKEPVAPGSKHTTRVPHSSAIRLIDFGSATWETQYHSSVVSTRHYRAPEVILGMPWSYPCDSWSVGCILIELLTVRPACCMLRHATSADDAVRCRGMRCSRRTRIWSTWR
jgi:dual-specificity kinase